MKIQDEDIGTLTILLSPERLGALTRLTGSARTAIELHQETLSLGASLMTVTATIEIALRNSICENLSQHFGVPRWLQEPPIPFVWQEREAKKIIDALDSAQRAEYAKLTQVEKRVLDVSAFPKGRPKQLPHLTLVRARRQQIAVSEGKVIAELTLYFWKRLFGPDYEKTLWLTTLKKTFPNKQIKRGEVASHLEQIYQSRNRLAHHEPVLHKRFADTMNAIKFVVENLGIAKGNNSAPLERLVANDVAEVYAKAKALHARLDSFRVRS